MYVCMYGIRTSYRICVQNSIFAYTCTYYISNTNHVRTMKARFQAYLSTSSLPVPEDATSSFRKERRDLKYNNPLPVQHERRGFEDSEIEARL